MDDKIIEGLDNLDVTETDQLLDSIDINGLGEELDAGAIDRIKTSVLQKAGIKAPEIKRKLIPNKARLFTVSLIISIIELLFFTSSAFTAWIGGFLENSGINLSLGGILPTILYIVMFGALSLSVYMAMFNMDSDRFTMDMLIPKNRTSIIYTVYFISSAALKILFFIAVIFSKEKIDDLLYYDYETFTTLMFFVLFVATLTAVDMLLSKLKNWIILKFEGTCSLQWKWRIGIKAFFLELLKYGVILGYIIVFALMEDIGANKILEYVIGFAFLVGLNIFTAIVVQLKKRNSFQMELTIEKASDNNKAHKESEAEPVKRLSFIRRRIFVFGLSTTAVIYLLCLLAPYIVNTGLITQKPMLAAFSNSDEAKDFFTYQKLPFTTILNTKGVSDFTEALFMTNRFFVGALTFNNDMFLRGVLAGGTKGSTDMIYGRGALPGAVPESIDGGSDMDGAKAEGEFSSTNTQVKNVDEADVIKTDGKYVYYLNQSKMYIAQADPPENMKIVYQYDFSKDDLYPMEMFLYKQHIAVILKDYSWQEENEGYNRYSPNTIVRTYNIDNPSNPTLERIFKLDYPYLTSRMVENNLYLVATTYLDNSKLNPEYFDSATGNSIKEIDYKDLFLMRGNSDENYRQINVVASLPIDDSQKEAKIKGFIGGGGETVYMSTEHIYIVESSSNAITEAPVKEFLNTLTDKNYRNLNFSEYGTNIYRVKIKDGNIGDFDSAFVPGRVNNQFSMDEYDGYFRLTTQKGNWNYASSGVYVLDSAMNLCGSLEGLAPEESIFSSRFMGDRLYLVTFKKVDPLFVISLKDPKKPTVLGKLKIPGYSEYIHPLDENHIIGFGKDTKGGNDNFSWYQGIKMAIFDVSDVNNPKEKFVEKIGDRGSDSELLRNHKALMYMKNLGLMAFPVTLYEKTEEGNDSEYGEFSYQGAYVYNVSSDEGFKLRGKITHLGPESKITSSNVYDNENTSFINRIIYANEALYTFSGDKVKATRYSDMKEVSQIPLK